MSLTMYPSQQASSQSAQTLKFTTSDSCDRIKDEFQFLQAQYHRYPQCTTKRITAGYPLCSAKHITTGNPQGAAKNHIRGPQTTTWRQTKEHCMKMNT